MKVIDKTPLQNDKGEIGLVERIQGTLKYGFSWYPELEAQKLIITQLDRALEKGFVLIRNFTLPGIEITEPIILIGPPGVYIIYVTPLSGFYEAKGDQWNTVDNGRGTPAPINLMSRAARLAKALQVYIERQGVNLPNPIEPVLMASSPAMHIDSMRPAVRVVMSDAVKQFAGSLLQARPVLQTEFIHDLADRIVNPRPKSAPQQTPQAPVPPPQAAAEAAQPAASRAQAIFRASEEATPLNPNDLGFAFEDAPAQAFAPPGGQLETSQAQARPAPSPARRGMNMLQWAFLGVMFAIECCVIIGFGYLIIFANR